MPPNKGSSTLAVFTDGASRYNPGPPSCAYIAGYEGQPPFRSYKLYLGPIVTNNMAEYQGMARALLYLTELTNARSGESFDVIKIYTDSKLVVEQVNGNWQVRQQDLKSVHAECRSYLAMLRGRGYQVSLHHILRHENSQADRLCNQALDEALHPGQQRPAPLMPTNMRILLQRDGSSGTDFHVVLFDWCDGDGRKRNMIAVVFPKPGACAVFDVNELSARRNLQGLRGDTFERPLREAIVQSATPQTRG